MSHRSPMSTLKKPSSIVFALLIALVASTAFARRAPKADSERFVPPPEAGVIYTVIDFNREGGINQGTVVQIQQGSVNRKVTVGAPYNGPCAETTPAGFVLKIRHPRPDQVPLILTTNGSIVRGPFQGELPVEAIAACYHIVT
jgi:hypothetical protein